MIRPIAAFTCLLCLTACGQKNSAPIDICSAANGEEGVVKATHDIEILDQPDGKRVLNSRATEALRRQVYYDIDPTVNIERICSEHGWTKVRAKGLDFSGWVRDEDVEPIPRDGNGVRVYVQKDITFMDDDWSPREKSLKPVLLAKFNELSRVCHDLEPLVMTAPASTASSPLFNFTCDDGHPHFIPYQPGK